MRSPWLLGCSVLLILVGVFGLMFYLNLCAIQRDHDHAYRQGVEHRRRGVSAEANPFKGGYGTRGDRWLQGWLDAGSGEKQP